MSLGVKGGVLGVEGKMHLYEVRPRKDHRGVDLVSDALPFGPSYHVAGSGQ
jgi:hypothetical protein